MKNNPPVDLSFIFLQGIRSPFFARLAERLCGTGASVLKVNFTAGDELSWPRSLPAVSYRQRVDDLEGFYLSLFAERKATDVVLFGDGRPVHAAAISVARRLGVRIHVFEEGYFRPYWITLEHGGVNANSGLPRDPDWYRMVGDSVPEYGNGTVFKTSFLSRAWHDVRYNAVSLTDRWRYPSYKTHNLDPIWREYGAYVTKAWALRGRPRRDGRVIAELISAKRKFFLFALQLNSDVQIRHHSNFQSMSDVVDYVMPSFAQFADQDAVLMVKNHPLDPGIERHEAKVRAVARELGISARVEFLESGHLPTILTHAAGVVVVNSTVGGSALVHALPTIALGKAIYDMPGLTHQGGLDSFWREGQSPDMKLFRQFRNVVIHATQVNGGFYTKSGIDLAVPACVSRLLDGQSRMQAFGPA